MDKNVQNDELRLSSKNNTETIKNDNKMKRQNENYQMNIFDVIGDEIINEIQVDYVQL